ncbi:uncharacterized protein GGS22DRAFT_173811 [Annulohypoxylon maeteangense]|uniref:uncharacterized protein n=1 Tax=Annulohypoxylon maeteangense TaxID=1927788 RepID=UPI002007D958|nr:uncharacterized protein GGS22DRAFT_173811 [Annulohypoxylon maeteangense]KAI0880938.1 hypothetical protein GGS22DRAFT_173811 [Annulohypoxylon maeteangense]
MPSLPPPVSPAPMETPTQVAAQPATGVSVGCLSMTTLTMASRTFSWCAQVASGPQATSTPSGEYAFSARDYVELPGPSTWSTVLRSSSSVSQSESSTNSESPSPSACGNRADVGDFTFNFDDLPPLGSGSDPNVGPMPLFSPYHRFYFSPGFSVLPPPPAPYDPSSGKLMIQFTPPSLSNLSEPDATAQISVGPQTSSDCFPFNFNGFSLGCNSTDSPCSFNFTGMRFDEQAQQEKEVVSLTIEVPACPSLSNCKLIPIEFTGFEKLTSVLINLKVDDKPKTWWADDLALGWSDNQCEKAVCRSKVRDTVRKRDGISSIRRAISRPLDFALFRG